MSNQKKIHELIRQNEKVVKKPKKHDANLQKNSTIYFQVGLIVCLLAAYGLLEMNFETTIPTDYGAKIPDDITFYTDVPVIIPQTPVLEEPVEQNKSKSLDKFIEVPDNNPENPIVKKEIEPKTDTPPIGSDYNPPLAVVPEDVDIPFVLIQDAPIYPGCEKAKNNNERKKCMSEKITKLIQRKFNGNGIASNYGLTGKQKIDVQFKIDKTGHVTNIKTRAPHPKLEDEAKRVVNFIPTMTPGKQHDKNVGVIYTLPIVFQVE